MTQPLFTSLRTRATLILTAIFMFACVACVLVVGFIITDRLDEFERGLAASNVRRARNALQQDMKRLDDLLKDWAWWDDTYAFMQDASQEFIDSNITPDVFRNQGLDVMIFVSPDGRVVHSAQWHREDGELFTPSGALVDYATGVGSALSPGDEMGGAPELVVLDGELWVAANRAVLTSQQTGPATGRMWMIKKLDTLYVRDLARRTELDLRLGAARADALPAVMAPLAGAGPDMPDPLVAEEGGTVWSGLLLRDAAGGAPVALIVHAPRELAAYVGKVMRTSLAVVAAFGVAGFFAGLAFLDKLVLSRLSALSSQLVKDAPDAQICSLGAECDEIDQLAALMEGAFRSIRGNERFLSEVLGALKVGVMLVRKRDRVVVSANSYACALMGRSEGEIVGRGCRRDMCMGPKDRRPADMCPLCELERDVDNARSALFRSDGARIDILKSVATITRDGQEYLLETFLDIREMESTRRLLEESEERYRAIFMNTGTPGILINEDTSIAVANREFLHLIRAGEEILAAGPSWTRFFIAEDAQRMLAYHERRRSGENGAPRSYEARLVDEEGGLHYVRVTVAMIPRSSQSIAFFLDITDIKRAEGKLQELAYTDALTGLPNRLCALERLSRTLEGLKDGGESIAVLLLDLDDFKIVNDSWGHAAGDVVLMEVGQRLLAAMSPGESVGRLGGDEFIIVSAAGGDEAQWEALARKLISAMTRSFEVEDSEIYLGVSVGIAVFPRDGDTAGQLVRCADLAMYRSKASGKSMFQFHAPELTRQAQRRMEIERELRLALDGGEIEAFFQPIVDIGSGRIVGAEALARWRKADGTLVPPVEFIPVAEQTNLITEIDMGVLRQACLRAREWERDGLGLERVSCNVSARHFQRGDLVGDVAKALGETDLAAERLSLEVTETVYMENIDQARDTLDALGRMGIRIALDDFGTGYSSLSYVRSLSFDVLKIDKSFVRNLPEESSLALVRAMLGIAANLGITPLAEGIETEAQSVLLRSLGCRLGQGYLFSPPIPAARFRELLEKQVREA